MARKEQEILDGTKGSGGIGAGKAGQEEKTEAEKLAETIGKDMSSSNKTANDVLENYI